MCIFLNFVLTTICRASERDPRRRCGTRPWWRTDTPWRSARGARSRRRTVCSIFRRTWKRSATTHPRCSSPTADRASRRWRPGRKRERSPPRTRAGPRSSIPSSSRSCTRLGPSTPPPHTFPLPTCPGVCPSFHSFPFILSPVHTFTLSPFLTLSRFVSLLLLTPRIFPEGGFRAVG